MGFIFLANVIIFFFDEVPIFVIGVIAKLFLFFVLVELACFCIILPEVLGGFRLRFLGDPYSIWTSLAGDPALRLWPASSGAAPRGTAWRPTPNASAS